ncbi:MAG: nitric oxide synthase oxygenase [Flavobacteriales bacterium]|nr:nitric oxide synthase oxygenase [Flavobacteriales bacterium]
MTERSLREKAKAYLELCYRELSKEDLFEERWCKVQNSIEEQGTYELLDFELDYGTKVAWRNSNKCIGRLFWRSMEVLDQRSLGSMDTLFAALFEHIDFAYNGGNIRSTISVFNAHKGIRIVNPQLLGFAAYEQEDGSVVGDPKHLMLTKECVKLGWEPKMGAFDLLPIVIQKEGETPVWKEIPKDLITLVSIEHPNIKAISDLNLKWYATPIISNMTLEVGGIEFMAAPFNGWYMGTEIGARNLADEDRYNLLPIVAEKMGLDIRDKNALWKDRALVELNQAVLYSFRKAGVKIIDHHSASKQFMQFMRQEAKEGRDVTADWSWIVPPTSGSTTKVFHTEMQDIINSPNYFYQEDPWD